MPDDDDVRRACNVLGVTVDAEDSELEAAYRLRARAHHPDFFPVWERESQEHKMKELNWARDTLRRFRKAARGPLRILPSVVEFGDSDAGGAERSVVLKLYNDDATPGEIRVPIVKGSFWRCVDFRPMAMSEDGVLRAGELEVASRVPSSHPLGAHADRFSITLGDETIYVTLRVTVLAARKHDSKATGPGSLSKPTVSFKTVIKGLKVVVDTTATTPKYGVTFTYDWGDGPPRGCPARR